MGDLVGVLVSSVHFEEKTCVRKLNAVTLDETTDMGNGAFTAFRSMPASNAMQLLEATTGWLVDELLCSLTATGEIHTAIKDAKSLPYGLPLIEGCDLIFRKVVFGRSPSLMFFTSAISGM